MMIEILTSIIQGKWLTKRKKMPNRKLKYQQETRKIEFPKIFASSEKISSILPLVSSNLGTLKTLPSFIKIKQ